MSDNLKPTDYLLNYDSIVPGTMEAVYDVVSRENGVTLDACRSHVQFRNEGDSPEDHVLNAVNFLAATDVLRYDGTHYFAPRGVLEAYAFRVLLLRGLRQQTGRQGDIFRIYELLIQTGITGIEVTKLMALLNEEKLTTPGKSALSDFKLGFWMRLMDFIGVVHQLNRAKTIALTPDCGLMLYLLREFSDGAREVSVSRFLEHVNLNCFPVTTQQGELHPGLGAALARMVDRGMVGTTSKSDAAPVRLSATASVTHFTLREGEGLV